MASEPKPMDPERLADIRRRLAGERVPWIEDADHRDVLAELLAAYDHLHVDFTIQVELLDEARAQRDALRAKLTEHGVTDTDPDVRRYKDRLLGVQESAIEWTLKDCESGLAAALGQCSHEGWESLLAVVSQMREEVAELPNVTAERDRARELLAGARHQCERRMADLAEAHVSIRHLQREAVVGHFVLALDQLLHRLRRFVAERPDDFPWGVAPDDIADVVVGEIVEVRAEMPGSPSARRESADVFVAALHLLLVHGGVPLVELEAAHNRIKHRLDVMEEHDCSWSAAKRIIQELDVTDG
jgi:hypothetical protein